MKKILYVFSHIPKEQEEPFLIPQRGSTQDVISVVLIQGAVCFQKIVADYVYVLEEDVKFLGVETSYTLISYRDLLKMVFVSDSVVVI